MKQTVPFCGTRSTTDTFFFFLSPILLFFWVVFCKNIQWYDFHTLMSLRSQMDHWKASYTHGWFLRLLYSSGIMILKNYFLGTNSDVMIDMTKSLFDSANLHTNIFFQSQKNPPDFNIKCWSIWQLPAVNWQFSPSSFWLNLPKDFSLLSRQRPSTKTNK